MQGRVELLFVGHKRSVRKQPCALIELRGDGIIGDRHSGPTKKADGRDKGFVRGTIIRNWRQWSAISTEELEEIGSRLAVPEFDGTLLGSNIVISGIPAFTKLPKGTLLQFPNAALFVEDENAPCTKAGKLIASEYLSVTPHGFVAAARGRRGLVGVVHTPGTIHVGDEVRVVIPSNFSATACGAPILPGEETPEGELV